MPVVTSNPPNLSFLHDDVPHTHHRHTRQYVGVTSSSESNSTITTIVVVFVVFFALTVVLAFARKCMGSQHAAPRPPAVVQPPRGSHQGPVIAEILASQSASGTTARDQAQIQGNVHTLASMPVQNDARDSPSSVGRVAQIEDMHAPASSLTSINARDPSSSDPGDAQVNGATRSAIDDAALTQPDEARRTVIVHQDASHTLNRLSVDGPVELPPPYSLISSTDKNTRLQFNTHVFGKRGRSCTITPCNRNLVSCATQQKLDLNVTLCCHSARVKYVTTVFLSYGSDDI
ncbi:hypothetical protein JVU11DRAFT_8634 [Chiua virens]|nr:hypothetical protein JVU11DRAFT_8634 [Chiua virens]